MGGSTVRDLKARLPQTVYLSYAREAYEALASNHDETDELRGELALAQRILGQVAQANGGQVTLAGPHSLDPYHLAMTHHENPFMDGQCYDTLDRHEGDAAGCQRCLDAPPHLLT